MSNHTVTIRYGELDLEVHVYVEPPEPEIGIRSPQIDIEEIHLTRQYFNSDGVELDMNPIEQFVLDRYDKDQAFAMTLQDLVLTALEEGARQRVEDVDHYPKVSPRHHLTWDALWCTCAACIDRRAV